MITFCSLVHQGKLVLSARDYIELPAVAIDALMLYLSIVNSKLQSPTLNPENDANE